MKKTLTLSLALFIQVFFCAGIYSSNILLIKNDNNTSSLKIYNDALSFGHTVQTVQDNEVTIELLNQFDVVILACGKNSVPVTSATMRGALSTFSQSGGKILIEGGDVSFVSSVAPQNNGFAAKVLRMKEWTAHSGGNLNMNTGFSASLLATVPNELPALLSITYNSTADMDACGNDLFSERFYTCSSYPGDNGIIVYPTVANPQIIFFTFNYTSVTNPAEGKNLLENCLHRLGNIPIGINTISTEIPSAFKVFPNYPNPFNPSTKIRFSLPHAGKVKISIFDVSGKLVEEIADEQLSAGTYESEWRADNLSSGIYFALVSAENYSSVIKMTLLK